MECRIDRVEPATAAWRGMVALRHRVLREPLGLAFTDEQLAGEKDQLHLALWHGDVLAGAVLLVRPDAAGTARLRQMAIDRAFERNGFGTALARRGEAELIRLGARKVVLAAREGAVEFYERLGYVAQGDPFIEVTIPHLLMVKAL